jgi:hypothetical protein
MRLCVQAMLADWRRAYWGANYERLLGIKQAYDPTNLFTKPLTVGAPFDTSGRGAGRRRLRVEQGGYL